MLQITVPALELFDEEKLEFVQTKEQTLVLEHSLVSLSKWESKWNKAFLSNKEKTHEETLDYIRFMTINKNVDPQVYTRLTSENIQVIDEYIAAPMTATYFFENEGPIGSRDTVTAELVYYWMITLNIPFECQKWHLNRLFALIKVCNIKSQPNKRMSRGEIMQRNASLNDARRRKYNTKG